MLLTTTNFLHGDSDELCRKPPGTWVSRSSINTFPFASSTRRSMLGSRQVSLGAVELHAVEVRVVRVLARFAAVADR